MAIYGFKENFYPLLEEYIDKRFGKDSLIKEHLNEWTNGEPNTNENPIAGPLRPIPLNENEVKKPDNYINIKLTDGTTLPMRKIITDIEDVRDFLTYFDPIYSKYLDALIPIYTFSVKTMATDGKRLFINPYFAYHLDVDEKLFVLLHEIFHNLLDHHVRRKDRDPYLWNCAADFEINTLLVDLFPPAPDEKGENTGFPEDITDRIKALYRKEFSEDDAESIYLEIAQKGLKECGNDKKNQDQQQKQQKQGPQGPGGTPPPQDPKCVGCKDCKDCPDCPDCKVDPKCEGCTDCEDCPDCPNCDVPEECKTCTDCKDCPDCPSCQGGGGGPQGPKPPVQPKIPGPTPPPPPGGNPQDTPNQQDKNSTGSGNDGESIDNPSNQTGNSSGGDNGGYRKRITVQDIDPGTGATITEEEGDIIAKKTGYTDEEIGEQKTMTRDDVWDKAKEDIANKIANNQIKIYGKTKAGNTPGAKLLKLLKKLQKGDVDWTAELRKYVGRVNAQLEKKWRIGNKKVGARNALSNKAAKYPGRKVTKKGKVLGNVILLVDVSGSMDDKTIKKIIIEINNVVIQKNIKKVTVAFFDTMVPNTPGAVQTIEAKNKTDVWVPNDIPGGGGTSFQAPIDWVGEHYGNNVELVMMFTDGYAEDPQPPKFYNKFIWIVYNNPGYKQPFGKQINLLNYNGSK